jgi:hypothetical protein
MEMIIRYIGYNMEIWLNRNGLGNIKMMLENFVSIGLTIICGVLALYSFIRSQSN